MGFRAPRKLYRHPRMKRKGVFFQGDLNPVGPEGFIIYTILLAAN